VPVADYRDRLPLTGEQANDVSVLWFVDVLTLEHRHPAMRCEVDRWCREVRLGHVELRGLSKGCQFAIVSAA
jgi:hypothetical protein